MSKFGDFGGQFVPETLMNPLRELEDAYKDMDVVEREVSINGRIIKYG